MLVPKKIPYTCLCPIPMSDTLLWENELVLWYNKATLWFLYREHCNWYMLCGYCLFVGSLYWIVSSLCFLASADREVSVYFMFSSAKGLENIFIFCCGTLYVCLHKPIILSLGFNLSPAFSSYVYKSSTSTRNKSCIHNYFTGGSRTMKLWMF